MQGAPFGPSKVPGQRTGGVPVPGGALHVVRQAFRLRWAVSFWVIAAAVATLGRPAAWAFGSAVLVMGAVTGAFIGLGHRREGPGPVAFLVALELPFVAALGWAIFRGGGVVSPLMPALLAGPAMAGMLAFDRRAFFGLAALQVALFAVASLAPPLAAARAAAGDAPVGALRWTWGLGVASGVVYLGTLLVEQERLRRATVFEPRTGLYSREFVLARLRDACQGVGGLRPPFSVLMADLDDFKRINDLHGHQTGDWGLSEAAYVLRSNLRSFDLAGRFGGEEFLIVLSGTLEDDAVAVAERLCRAIEKRAARPAPGQPALRLTVSIGVAAYGPGRDTVEELIAAADRALYWAKQHGKNRAVGVSRLPADAPALDRRRT